MRERLSYDKLVAAAASVIEKLRDAKDRYLTERGYECVLKPLEIDLLIIQDDMRKDKIDMITSRYDYTYASLVQFQNYSKALREKLLEHDPDFDYEALFEGFSPTRKEGD